MTTTLRRSRRASLWTALAVFLLHTVAVLGIWQSWGEFGRGNVLSWMDFPTSLAYLHLDGTPMLLWSLIGGGLQWAVVMGLLTMFLGWAARSRTR